MYTSPTEHPADSTIRDVFHPLFDEYGVDIVFSGDNHNYQRTFPLKYNSEGGSYSSNNPIISKFFIEITIKMINIFDLY